MKSLSAPVRMLAFTVVVPMIVGVSLAACTQTDEEMENKLRMDIDRQLKVGDGPDLVSQYLRSMKVQPRFNNLSTPNRWAFIIRNVGKGILGTQSIQVHILVDEGGRFLGHEVFMFYENTP